MASLAEARVRGRTGRMLKGGVRVGFLLVLSAAGGLALLLLNDLKQATAHIAGVPDHPDYNWDVRPILSENCFRCHGPNANSRQASLRLDVPEVAFAELKEAPGKYAIVPGKPERSVLVQRITSTDPEKRMPPKELHKVLSAKDIAILRTWISQGAKYKPHWAFVPPEKVPPPRTKYSDRAVSSIDRFVFARIEREGLRPSPEADKETLINRVTLSLTGLPPSLAEVDAYVKDNSSNAYEKIVDRLLASPAYGERMGAYWMDVARWAETDGFLDDRGDRLLWPWRDWMIAAFNKNMPYDQFVTWQLAGDLLPNHTEEQVLATAFGRLGKRNTEDGTIDEEYRVEYTIDRTSTVGTAFLGLTVGCARCHDHKYDPVSQKDFYSLSGFFNNLEEPGFYPKGSFGVTAGPTLRWTDKETEAKIAEANAKIRAREADFRVAEEAAAGEVSPQIDALLQKPAEVIATTVRKSVDAATVAYYPFDRTVPIPPARMPKRTPVSPPREIVPSPQLASLGGFSGGRPPGASNSSGQRGKGGVYPKGDRRDARKTGTPNAPPYAKQQRPAGVYPNQGTQKGGKLKTGKPAAFRGLFGNSPLPGDWVASDMVFSPNLVSPSSPAVLQRAILKPGVKGNALWFDDTNKGMLPDDVGRYERTQPFGFDVWVYLASVYKDSTILNNRDDVEAGTTGYQLNLEDNILRFDIIHTPPYNMISIATKKPLPLKEWVHVSVTYDGSSRASGVKLYLYGEQAEVEVRRDNLSESALPRGGGTYDPWSGFAFGKRMKPQPIPGSAIDELRIFSRALTPVEVRYLDKQGAALHVDRRTLRRELIEMAVANNPRVVQAGSLLTEARDAQNQIVSVVPQVMVMGDAPKPKQAYVLLRGLYDQHGEPVEATGLSRVLSWNDRWPRNRLGLAMWLFDKKNPLTSRVFVNRLWQLNFAKGLVETSDDFGLQGSIPTHPELLDWLAVDFVESNWNIKRMQKVMVMSATFRQSSNATDELLRKDPRNLLLGRGVRQRLPAEMVRDSALANGGLLVRKLGGPSVYPYQPDGVWVGVFGGYPRADRDHLEDLHRKSIYSYVKRNIPPPSMMVFDMNDRSYSSVRLNTSNTPLQALVLLDDPQYVEAYRGMATRALKSSPDKQEQIKLVYRLATRRSPTNEELTIMRQYYDDEAARFTKSEDDADKFLGVGLTPVDPGVDRVQLAALTSVAAAVMNTPDAFTLR
jgi:hypothetical protein